MKEAKGINTPQGNTEGSSGNKLGLRQAVKKIPRNMIRKVYRGRRK